MPQSNTACRRASSVSSHASSVHNQGIHCCWHKTYGGSADCTALMNWLHLKGSTTPLGFSWTLSASPHKHHTPTNIGVVYVICTRKRYKPYSHKIKTFTAQGSRSRNSNFVREHMSLGMIPRWSIFVRRTPVCRWQHVWISRSYERNRIGEHSHSALRLWWYSA